MSHPSVGFFTPRQRIGAAVLTLTLVLTMALPAVAAPAGPAALPLIDHFDSDQTLIQSTGTPVSSSISDANVLGGWRDLSVDLISGTGGARVEVAGAASEFRFSSDSSAVGQGIVQWDGVSGFTTPPSATAGPYDLTLGSAAQAITVTSLFNDLLTDVAFRVYSGVGNWSVLTVTLPGGQTVAGSSVSYYWPFAAFTTEGGTGANFANVTAVEMVVAGTAGADLTLHNVTVEAYAVDWGDLPDTYYTTLSSTASGGPRHLVGTLYLGTQIDAETDGVPSTGADGDDSNSIVNDEDGVVKTPNVKWQVGTDGGSVDITVTGGPGCLTAWVDWDNDGDFFTSGDKILDNILVSTGTQTFDIPAGVTFNGSYYARFRLFPTVEGGGCGGSKDYTGFVENGEVEDYQWAFGPNAVTLSGLQASPAAVLPLAPLGLAALGGFGAAVIVRSKRRR